MPTYALEKGVTGAPGWGDRWKFTFSGTWAFNETWKLDGTIQSTGLTIGSGQVTDRGVPTTCFTYKKRVYLGTGAQFNFSDNTDPTSWEIQAPGSGFIGFMSELGGQDSMVGLGQFQGRVVGFGRSSIQIFTTDADPNLFANVQSLANIGTRAALSVQNIGDYDIMFLDDTGIRSLRARETTLNAFPDDVGTPVDELVRLAKVGYTVANAAAIVDPVTKNYWLHVGGTIFVFSRHASSEVNAWSTYEPRGDDNVLFTPEKFVVYLGQVYCRSTQRGLYQYGGANGSTYDVNSQVTLQLPWLDDKRPGTQKCLTSVDFVLFGKWSLKGSTNPKQVNFEDEFYNSGTAATPTDLTDASYDDGNVPWSANGTHFSVLAVSANTSTSIPVRFCSITIHYNIGNVA